MVFRTVRLERVVDFFFGVMWKASLGAVLGLVGGVVIGAALGGIVGPFEYLGNIAVDDDSAMVMIFLDKLYEMKPEGELWILLWLMAFFGGVMIGGFSGLVLGPSCGALIGGIGAVFAWAFPVGIPPSLPSETGFRSTIREIGISLTGKAGALICGMVVVTWVSGVFYDWAVADPQGYGPFGFFGAPIRQLQIMVPKYGLLLGGLLSVIAWSPQPLTVRTVSAIVGMMVVGSMLPGYQTITWVIGGLLGAAAVDVFAALRKPEYHPRILIGVAAFLGFWSGGFDGALLFGLGMWAYLGWKKKRKIKIHKPKDPVRTLAAQGLRIGAKTGLMVGAGLGFIFGMNAAVSLVEIWSSTITAGIGGCGLVAFGGAIVGMVTRKVPADARMWGALLSGLFVGTCFGVFGELVYQMAGGELVANFAPPYDMVWVRGLTAAIVGIAVGWMIFERWRTNKGQYDAQVLAPVSEAAATEITPTKEHDQKKEPRRLSFRKKLALAGCCVVVLCVGGGLSLAYLSISSIMNSSDLGIDWGTLQQKLETDQPLTTLERAEALKELEAYIRQAPSVLAQMEVSIKQRESAGFYSKEAGEQELKEYQAYIEKLKRWQARLLAE